ncbi:hypothetical protein [Streptomyces sp. NPDC048639]
MSGLGRHRLGLQRRLLIYPAWGRTVEQPVLAEVTAGRERL